MTLALARAVIGVPPRRVGRVPRQKQPNTQRFAYSLIIGGMVDEFRNLVREHLLSLLPALAEQARQTHDAKGYSDRVTEATERIAEEWLKKFPAERLRAMAESMGRRVSTHNADQLRRQLSSALRKEINIDVLASGAKVESRIREWASSNASLIKDVSERARAEIAAVTSRALRAGKRAEDIGDEIAERLNVAESRGRLIARDQIGKLNGELNAARQKAMGIPGFTWHTVGDERVRDEHEALDGKYFKWSSPPDEGMPGEPIDCRCTAEPDVEGLIDEL